MNRSVKWTAVAVAFAGATVTAGCGTSHKAPHTHRISPVSVQKTTDPEAVAACKQVDQAVAAIPANPTGMDTMEQATKVQNAAFSVRGVAHLGTDLATLGNAFAKGANGMTADQLNTYLGSVSGDCAKFGYTLIHDSIG